MHQALYRKWRPKDFDSVCGQEHITSVLRYEIINNRYSHAYLFCGSRGTGKTTCAKLLAKAVNCLSPENGSPCGKCEACLAIEKETTTDVIEMDAASNTGVDYIREIREAVMYAPSMLKNRVYIIDEVHMLSQNAFNALLKTLEEPPSQVVFILATTEQQKIPATILSRCQKFEFRRISSEVITDRLMYISECEGFETEPEGAKLIAKMSQGGMRDAISLLELCAGEGKKITLKNVRAVTGSLGREQAANITDAVAAKDVDALFEIISNIVSSAKDIQVFWQELIDFYRDMLVFKTSKYPQKYLDLTKDEEERISSLSKQFSSATLIRHCTLIEETYTAMLRPGASKRLCAEMTFLKMCDEKLDTYPEGLTMRLSALEEKLTMLASGTPIQQPPQEQEVKKPALNTENTAMFKKSVTVTENETEKPIQKSENTRVRTGLKPVSWWMEAAKKISDTNPSLAPFMKLSKGYQNGNKILIRAEGEMAIYMLDTPDTRAKLATLAQTISGTPHSPDCFEFIEITPETENLPIDELV